jgi:glycosyltransferase 2 family protein
VNDAAAPARRRTPVWLRVVQALLVAAIVVALWHYLAHSWSAVSAYEWQVRPAPLLASLALFVAFYLLNAFAWWLLLRGAGLRPGKSAAMSTWSVSILARYLPGSVFVWVGRVYLGYRRGIEPERASAAIVYEQALAFAAALATIAALFPFWHYHRSATAWGVLAIPVIVALLHPRVFAPVANAVLRLARRRPLPQVLRFRVVLGMLAYYVGVWLVCGLGAWTFAEAVTHVTASAIAVVAAGVAAGYVAGMLAFFIPSGIGVRESVTAAVVAGTLPGGAVALAWALLLRLWQTVVELAFVGAMVVADRLLRHPEREAG